MNWQFWRKPARKPPRFQARHNAVHPERNKRLRPQTEQSNLAPYESGEQLRNMARELEQNSDIISSALQILETRIVGTGITPIPRVLNSSGEPIDDVNEQLAELHQEWSGEISGAYDEPGAQRITLRTWLRDGEVFVRHLVGQGDGVPYAYELIEPDYVPLGLIESDTKILSGIEIDDWKRPIAYYVSPQPEGVWQSSAIAKTELMRIPASEMSHLAFRQRIGQIRGLSAFASALKRVKDIQDIDEAERMAAKVAASLTLYVRRGEPGMYANAMVTNEEENDEFSADDNREWEFEAGTIIKDLQQGEDIGSVASNRPNPEIMAFRKEQMRALSGGLGVGYSSLAKDYSGTYSSQRQELVEQNHIYENMRQQFIRGLELEKWRRFVSAAQLAGQFTLPSNANQESLLNPDWSPPHTVWIDPLKEAEAWGKLVERGFESRKHVIRLRGREPHRVEEEREGEELLGPMGQPPMEQEESDDQNPSQS